MSTGKRCSSAVEHQMANLTDGGSFPSLALTNVAEQVYAHRFGRCSRKALQVRILPFETKLLNQRRPPMPVRESGPNPGSGVASARAARRLPLLSGRKDNSPPLLWSCAGAGDEGFAVLRSAWGALPHPAHRCNCGPSHLSPARDHGAGRPRRPPQRLWEEASHLTVILTATHLKPKGDRKLRRR